jgi:acetyl esterase/lipase
MEWVYAAITVNGAIYTINAFRPIKRNRVLFGWSLVASWVTIEFAWLHLLGQLFTIAFFVRKGVLANAAGRFGLVVNLMTCVGLLILIRRSLAVRADVRAAFAEVDSGSGSGAVPAARRRLGLRRRRNIIYGHAGGKDLKLDVYQPRRPALGDRAGLRPAIVQIHGGGWVLGDKREQGLPLLTLLASQGWVGFNVNYRLSPGATFPDHLIDIKRAVAWIRDHADEYDVDPRFICVTGGSAGGHLAALLALTANDPAYQPGFEDADTSIQGAVPFYGLYDFADRNGYFRPGVVNGFLGRVVLKATLEDEPEKFAAASPIDQVRPDAPPFLVVHGSLDTLVPVGFARDFVAALRAVSEAPVLYLEARGAQHAFEIFPSIRTTYVIRAVDQFLDALYCAYRQGTEPGDVPVETLAAAVEEAGGAEVTV